MKSKTFRAGSVVALGLAAMLLGAPAANADRVDLVFNWTGTCSFGCPAGQKVAATLDLAGNYDFGSAIANNNFGTLFFRSGQLQLTIVSLAAPTIGINKDGSLAGGNTISFRDSKEQLFSFKNTSGGDNWTAQAPLSRGLRGSGDTRFSPAGVLTVPEPSTWAMMLLGFLGLGLAALRRPTMRILARKA
jgi:PEP-CTERM motif